MESLDKDLSKQNSPKNRNTIAIGIPFIVSIALITALLFFTLTPFEIQLQSFEAQLVQKILNAIGTSTRATENPIQFYAENYLVEVSALCSGLLEMILLGAAILSTFHVPLKKRIMGMAVGIMVLFVFNLLRMSISIQQLIHTSLEFAEFTHGVLFRVVLILGFALIYGVWVHASRIKIWASKKGI